MLHHKVLLQLSTGAGGGGAGGARTPPKVLIWWKFGQTRGNLDKISKNLHKIPENLRKTLKIWAKKAPKITWRASFWMTLFLMDLFIFGQVCENSGNNCSRP